MPLFHAAGQKQCSRSVCWQWHIVLLCWLCSPEHWIWNEVFSCNFNMCTARVSWPTGLNSKSVDWSELQKMTRVVMNFKYTVIHFFQAQPALLLACLLGCLVSMFGIIILQNCAKIGELIKKGPDVYAHNGCKQLQMKSEKQHFNNGATVSLNSNMLEYRATKKTHHCLKAVL